MFNIPDLAVVSIFGAQTDLPHFLRALKQKVAVEERCQK